MATRISRLPSARALLLPLALCVASVPVVAFAADASIDQVYATARAGNIPGALTMMDQVLKDHPNSAKAHYMEAELLSRSHRAADARVELGKAEAIAPGLPFANAHSQAELRAALGEGGAAGAVAPAPIGQPAGHFPVSSIILIGLLIFAVLAMLRRRSAAQNVAPYNQAMGGQPMGPGGYPTGYGPQGGPGYGGGMMGGGMMGGGMGGGGLMGGLASGLGMGAGLAVGEEVVGHMFGGGRERGGEGGGWDQGGDPNADMGGSDFGISDSGSWGDSGGGGGDGGW